MKAAYEPRPLNPARRAALDARVKDRIERAPWPGRLAPAALAAAVAAVALFWGVRSGIDGDPARAPVIAGVEAPEAHAWETGLYLYDGSMDTAANEGVTEEILPPEYAAIDRLFFDG